MELQNVNAYTAGEARPQQERNAPIHGSSPHPDLENGPAEDRNCTDIIVCLLFICGCVGMVIVGSIGLKKGDPIRLTYPFDPDDQACGYDDQVKDYPYIYLVTPFPGFINRSSCLKNCPTWSAGGVAPTTLDCKVNQLVKSCNENEISYAFDQGFNSTLPTYNSLLKDTVFIYNTTGVFDRFCLVKQHYCLFLAYRGTLHIQNIAEWISDIQQTWPVILASIGVAYIFGFIYMILMRYCSGCVTWLSILLYFAIVVALGYFCFNQSKIQKDLANQESKEDTYNNEHYKNSQVLFYLAIALWVLAGLSFILFMYLQTMRINIRCYFSKIRLAIAIIKSAALFLEDVPTGLLIPICFGIILICFWAFWTVMFVFVFSVGDIKGSNSSPFATVTWDQTIRYLLLFEIFQGFWCGAFIHGLSEFILASTCALWYFSQGTGQSISAPVWKSVKRAFIYHMGSIAFGALILALVQTLKFVLEYLHKQVKAAGGDQNQPMKFFIDCLRCYASCFERFVQFLNKNAYIQIAISGKSFCTAAKDAFWLIYTNPGKFAVVEGIGHIFVDIGKYFVAFTTTVACYMVVTKHPQFKDKLFSPFFPVLLVFLISLTIGRLFMVVYGMGIDTILQCYCLDEELQKQKGRPAQHCPEPLKSFFDEHEQKSQQ